MSEIEDRIALGIDEQQVMAAERAAQTIARRIMTAPGIGSVVVGESDRVVVLLKQYERRRTALLRERPFIRLWADHDEAGRGFFTLPDHGDLLAPEFQFFLGEQSRAVLEDVTERLNEAYDPWSTWVAIAGTHKALGGRSPEEILCEPKDEADLDRVREVLIGLLPGNS